MIDDPDKLASSEWYILPVARPKKREARPLFDLILGILDTVQIAAQSDVRRAKEKDLVGRLI